MKPLGAGSPVWSGARRPRRMDFGKTGIDAQAAAKPVIAAPWAVEPAVGLLDSF